MLNELLFEMDANGQVQVKANAMDTFKLGLERVQVQHEQKIHVLQTEIAMLKEIIDGLQETVQSLQAQNKTRKSRAGLWDRSGIKIHQSVLSQSQSSNPSAVSQTQSNAVQAVDYRRQ